jgi:hypothetical protein
MQLPGVDVLIMLGVGVLFVILAVLGIIWSRVEENRYYGAMPGRTDLREYISHWPPRLEPGALKIGGWIALAIGLILLATGGYFWMMG